MCTALLIEPRFADPTNAVTDVLTPVIVRTPLGIYFITSNILGIVQYAMRGKANWGSLIPGFLKPK